MMMTTGELAMGMRFDVQPGDDELRRTIRRLARETWLRHHVVQDGADTVVRIDDGDSYLRRIAQRRREKLALVGVRSDERDKALERLEWQNRHRAWMAAFHERLLAENAQARSDSGVDAVEEARQRAEKRINEAWRRPL